MAETGLGFKNLMDFDKRFPDEQACREHLEHIRWNGEITCPYCSSSMRIYKLRTRNSTRYKCSECRKQFTVLVGTIFENTKIPLKKWFLAIYLATSHKKGVSSVQLAKHLGVTQKTAWFLLGRIRQAVRTKSFETPLSGVVEVDETYHGPRTKRKQKEGEEPTKRGRGSQRQTPVFGMVERGGELRMMPVENVQAKTLGAEMEKHITAPDSILMTDEYPPYTSIGKKFKRHESVVHKEEEYVRYYKNDDDRADAYTNTIEGAFSQLKRGIVGIYHHVSREHLHRYCAEFDYRYNTRKLKDAERFGVTLRRIEDRLTYKELIANGVWANRRKQEAQEREGQEGGEGAPET